MGGGPNGLAGGMPQVPQRPSQSVGGPNNQGPWNPDSGQPPPAFGPNQGYNYTSMPGGGWERQALPYSASGQPSAEWMGTPQYWNDKTDQWNSAGPLQQFMQHRQQQGQGTPPGQFGNSPLFGGSGDNPSQPVNPLPIQQWNQQHGGIQNLSGDRPQPRSGSMNPNSPSPGPGYAWDAMTQQWEPFSPHSQAGGFGTGGAQPTFGGPEQRVGPGGPFSPTNPNWNANSQNYAYQMQQRHPSSGWGEQRLDFGPWGWGPGTGPTPWQRQQGSSGGGTTNPFNPAGGKGNPGGGQGGSPGPGWFQIAPGQWRPPGFEMTQSRPQFG